MTRSIDRTMLYRQVSRRDPLISSYEDFNGAIELSHASAASNLADLCPPWAGQANTAVWSLAPTLCECFGVTDPDVLCKLALVHAATDLAARHLDAIADTSDPAVVHAHRAARLVGIASTAAMETVGGAAKVGKRIERHLASASRNELSWVRDSVDTNGQLWRAQTNRHLLVGVPVAAYVTGEWERTAAVEHIIADMLYVVQLLDDLQDVCEDLAAERRTPVTMAIRAGENPRSLLDRGLMMIVDRIDSVVHSLRLNRAPVSASVLRDAQRELRQVVESKSGPIDLSDLSSLIRRATPATLFYGG
jgi:hypothetical protein